MMPILLGFVISQMSSRNPQTQHIVVCCIRVTPQVGGLISKSQSVLWCLHVYGYCDISPYNQTFH